MELELELELELAEARAEHVREAAAISSQVSFPFLLTSIRTAITSLGVQSGLRTWSRCTA